MITSLIMLLGVLSDSATYKCKDAQGNWTEVACEPAKPPAAAAAPTVSVESKPDPDQRIILLDTFGCAEKSELQKLTSYRNDPDAMRQYAMLAVASGECSTFSKGEIVYRTESAFFDEMVKIRRKGDLREFWTVIQATVR